MKKDWNSKLLVLLIAVVPHTLYSQKAADEYAKMFLESADTVEPCRARDRETYRAVSEIDAMPLRCDSVFIDEPDDFENGRKHFYIGKRLFFDHKNRLRKYRTYKRGYDGGAEYMIFRAYYNENGKLIYLDYDTGTNCEDENAYYALRKNIVVEYDGTYFCGCCEDDAETEEEAEDAKPVKLKEQKTGKPMKYDVDWFNLSSFSDTETLLKVLDIYKYPCYESSVLSEFRAKGYNFADIIDEKEKAGELKKDTINLIGKKTGDNTSKDRTCMIILTYDANRKVQKCDIRKTVIYKHEEIEAEDVTAYYDTAGNLFYIDGLYTKDYENFVFLIKNGTIVRCNYFLNGDTKKMDYNAKEEFSRSFVGKKLVDIPCRNKNHLLDYSTTERLRKLIERLKREYSLKN
ncbi:hypothetical protein HW49_10230 [Porphyromonadaceae bacterium COT-184 OH4590]|nr:hypothetical protein HW49_10230 [Porphyromonadaceae bacterium COT-184 OH4590]